jgi:PTS system ascorbate-specific IIA component
MNFVMTIPGAFVPRLIPTLLAAALTASACRASATDARANAEAAAVSVQTITAAEQPIARFIRVSGTLTAQENADVAAEISGRVVSTPVERGTVVGANDPLIQIAATEVEAQARQVLERLAAPELLIFTDVFGATPCNIAQRLADGVRVKVVTGVNVPMLWRTLCYVDESLDAVVARAISGATQGVMQVATSRPQNQTLKRGHDQSDRQDQ